MRVYCGTDIIEVDRIKNSIEHLGERFLKRIYTENEINYCEQRKNMKYQHYAARFAAKEAIYKALSSLLKNKSDLSWTSIEILKDVNGRPYVNLVNIEIKEISNMDISLSHLEKYATATAIIVAD